jgi:hypothetical protein
MVVAGGSDRKVKVTRDLYNSYQRIFEKVAGGEFECNLLKFVMELQDEDERAALYLVVNDPLLVHLALEQPQKLLATSGCGAIPDFITWRQLVERLHTETRLDFSDVTRAGGGSGSGGRNSLLASFKQHQQDNGRYARELYKRFLRLQGYGDETEEDYNYGEGGNNDAYKGQEQHHGSSTAGTSSPTAPGAGAACFVDLTEDSASKHGQQQQMTSSSAADSMHGMNGNGVSKGMVASRLESPAPHSLLLLAPSDMMTSPPATAVLSAMPRANARQGGMGSIESKSPEESYRRATARVEEMMRQAAANREKASAANVVDLVSDSDGDDMQQQGDEDDGGDGNAMDVDEVRSTSGTSSGVASSKVAERRRPARQDELKSVEIVRILLYYVLPSFSCL